eukprot:Rmarinus@m.10069
MLAWAKLQNRAFHGTAGRATTIGMIGALCLFVLYLGNVLVGDGELTEVHVFDPPDTLQDRPLSSHAQRFSHVVDDLEPGPTVKPPSTPPTSVINLVPPVKPNYTFTTIPDYTSPNPPPFNPHYSKGKFKLPQKVDELWLYEPVAPLPAHDTCTPVNPHWIFWNRVPKTGGSSVQVVIRKLKKVNDFVYYDSYSGYTRGNSTDTLLEIEHVAPTNRYLFDRHQYFIPPEEFEARDIPFFTYFNIVREPMARLLSSYDYYRWGPRPHNFSLIYQSWPGANITFEECVRAYQEGQPAVYRDCMGWNSQMRYFCGSHVSCWDGSRAGLERAKANVEKYYVFVGVIEESNTSFWLMEQIMPKWFKGALATSLSIDKQRVNYDKRSGEPSEEIMAFVRSQNVLELEFYDWLVERLHRQRDACAEKLGIYPDDVVG